MIRTKNSLLTHGSKNNTYDFQNLAFGRTLDIESQYFGTSLILQLTGHLMSLEIAPYKLCFCIDLKNSSGYSKIKLVHPVICKWKILFCVCRPCERIIL